MDVTLKTLNNHIESTEIRVAEMRISLAAYEELSEENKKYMREVGFDKNKHIKRLEFETAMLNSFLKQRSDLEEAFKDLANDIKSFPDSVIVDKDGGINTESMDALNKAFTEK